MDEHPEFFDGEGVWTGAHGNTLAAFAGVRDSTLTTSGKVVAFALCSRAQPIQDEGWVCWPSLARIAKDTGLSRRQIPRALAELRAAGLVRWEKGGPSSSNRYQLNYLAMMALR